MKHRLHTFAARSISAAALACTAFTAQAALLVDTGAGSPAGGTALDNQLPGGFKQDLAGLFTLAAPTVVGAVSGWIEWREDGPLTFAVHSDAAGLPGAVLYSATVNLLATGSAAAWRSATGLNWALAAGDYWLSFEDVGGDTAGGAMPAGAPSPLAKYAYFLDTNANWAELTTTKFGVQIAAVPEPATYALLLAGFAALMSGRRRTLAKL